MPAGPALRQCGGSSVTSCELRADLLEGQEELVRDRALLQPDDGADVREQLPARRRVVRAADRGGERDVGLADLRLGAVHADAHALDRRCCRAAAFGSRLMNVGLVNR